MASRNEIAIQQAEFIGGGVVQTGDEAGGVWNVDPLRRQATPDRGVIQQPAQTPCAHFARLATAGAAVETGRVRIIGADAAVTGQENQRRKALGEAHGRQHLRGERYPGVGRYRQRRTQAVGLLRAQACA